MTAQIHEILTYGGEVRMATLPLKQYLETRKDIKFLFCGSHCWRGYQGKWEINNNKLFLVGLKASVRDEKGFRAVGLDYLFPGKSEVFAEWFSGEIRIQIGKIIEYFHGGFASVYEKDLYLKIDNGVLVSTREIDNRGKKIKPIRKSEKGEKEIIVELITEPRRRKKN